MEGIVFDPEFHWSPDHYIDVMFGDKPLKLRWGNTVVYKFELDDGKYDHLEHIGEDGEKYQFYLDDPELRESLERNGYSHVTSHYAPQELVDGRRDSDIDAQARRFMEELDAFNNGTF